jgi:Lon protease-like protein
MTAAAFAPSFAELPASLPIFPLTGVLLLPFGRLPLNIFEPRYLAMTRDALGAPLRLIGMIQPVEGAGDGGEPAVYRIGCAGRISEFAETEDGRYLITLTGVARFGLGHELARDGLYRRVAPDWRPYAVDLDRATGAAVDRKRLLTALKPYFARQGVAVEWPAIEATGEERLVTTVAMVCPFAPAEKQALLEAKGLAERAELLTTLLEMAVSTQVEPSAGARH